RSNQKREWPGRPSATLKLVSPGSYFTVARAKRRFHANISLIGNLSHCRQHKLDPLSMNIRSGPEEEPIVYVIFHNLMNAFTRTNQPPGIIGRHLATLMMA